MKELIHFVDSQLRNAILYPTQAMIYMHNAFGAVQFAEQVGLVEYDEVVAWWCEMKGKFEKLYTK